MVCHKCRERGHPTSRCPIRTPTMGLDNPKGDEKMDEIVYPLVDDTATESDHKEDERESSCVMRCFLSSTDCDS